MECLINEAAFNSLPQDLQEIVLVACKAANLDMLSEYTARNNQALKTLVDEHGVKVMALPDDVLKKLLDLSQDVVAELADSDAMARRVHDSVMNFKQQVSAWHRLSEQAFLRARAL